MKHLSASSARHTKILLLCFLASTLFVSGSLMAADETSSSPVPAAEQTVSEVADQAADSSQTGLQAAPEAAVPASETAQEDEALKEYQPQVVITPLGGELNLKVMYKHPMDFKDSNYIEYVRMETLEGEFLGLTTYNDKFTQATAEFMVNPQLAKFDTVRLVAKSSKLGLIKSVHKLELSSPDEIKASAQAETQAAASEAQKKSAAAPKKKLFGIF